MSCNDGADPVVDLPTTNSFECDNFIPALLSEDEALLASILDPELQQFTLLDQDNNLCLHDNNLRAFSELLTDTCDEVTASVICCGCVETFPLISEVLVQVDSVGIQVRRVLDLSTPGQQGEPLSFAGIHR